MNNSPVDCRSRWRLFRGKGTPRLYDRLTEVLRTRHHSRRTGEACLYRIRRFLPLHHGTDPRELAESDIDHLPEVPRRKEVEAILISMLTNGGQYERCN